MKILFVTCWYPNEGNKQEGMFVQKHARALLQTNHSIKVLAISSIPSSKLFKIVRESMQMEEGVEVYRISCYSRFYKGFTYFHGVWSRLFPKFYCQQLPSNWHPDVIHANVTYPAGYIANRLAKVYHTSYVITEHWSKLHHFITVNWFSSFARRALKEAKAYTVVSEFLQKKVKDLRPDIPVSIVPNVIAPVFNYAPGNTTDHSLVFNMVATWKAPKRPDLIFDALELVQKETTRQIILNVVGDGPLLQQCLQKKYSYQIQLHGNVVPQKIAEIHQSCHYFLHASDMETFSVVVAEALACGLPVCASDVGAISELIQADNGTLVQNTVQDWKNAIQRLINTNYQPSVISGNALRRYSESQVAKAFDEFYKSLGISQ